MLHEHVWQQFRTMFPQCAMAASQWITNGRNSIRVRINGREWCFTYHSADDWRLETKDSFIRTLKGEQ